jgi:hypothetical protein
MKNLRKAHGAEKMKEKVTAGLGLAVRAVRELKAQSTDKPKC